MNEETIRNMVAIGELRPRIPDKNKINSVLRAIEKNVRVTLAIPLSEDSATVVFREMYESVRQLGDAKWWILGYEPKYHETSIDILKEMDIKEKFRLNSLMRFKKIRHDANYRGTSVLAFQAREILDFWERCGKEILQILTKEAG